MRFILRFVVLMIASCYFTGAITTRFGLGVGLLTAFMLAMLTPRLLAWVEG